MFSISDACDASPTAPYIAVTDHCLSRPLAELMRRTFNYVPEVMRCTLVSYSPHLLGRKHQKHANAHIGKRDGTSAPRAMAPSTNTQPLLIGLFRERLSLLVGNSQVPPTPGNPRDRRRFKRLTKPFGDQLCLADYIWQVEHSTCNNGAIMPFTHVVQIYRFSYAKCVFNVLLQMLCPTSHI